VGGLATELERLREFERKVRVIANLPGAMREARVPEPDGKGGGEELPAVEAGEPEPTPAPVDAGAGDDLSARPGGGLDPAALARVQARARQLAGLVPTRKLSLLDLLEGLEGKSQKLAATPSIWPTDGYVTSGYGNRTSPFTGRQQFHAGLDIAADFGTTVVAPARGRVVFSGMNGPFGRMVEIDHGYGLRTHFAHLAKAHVKQGQTVERGLPIGEVGSTGRSTGPHLHYGVEVNGRTVDPTDYIFE
jgi:murein DD-endopeptidase MepM/ murein hydrolase activator NlpD